MSRHHQTRAQQLASWEKYDRENPILRFRITLKLMQQLDEIRHDDVEHVEKAIGRRAQMRLRGEIARRLLHSAIRRWRMK